MPSPYHHPVLISPEDKVTPLQPVDLSSKGVGQYEESWLQRLLFHHPEILPAADIDASYAGLMPLCIEMDTPSGPVDAVYVTETGRVALLEAKLWRNPEARRKVIAQILDYATQIAQWDFTRFDSAVRQARRRTHPTESFPGVAEWVASKALGTNEHTFIDSVSRTLRRGDFLLLVAGDGIREGAGAIAQFLDRYGTLHFTFGLIECAVYASPDGNRFVHPRILAQTTFIERTFANLPAAGWVEQTVGPTKEEQTGPEASAELAAVRSSYEGYWREFLEKLQVEDGQPLSKPASSTNQYFVMPPPSKGWVSAYLAQSKGEAGVYLTFEKGGIGERRLFDLLEAKRDEISAALGIDAEWITAPDGRRRVISTKSFPGALLTDSRHPSQDWLVDVTQRFVSVFRPRIEALLRDQD